MTSLSDEQEFSPRPALTFDDVMIDIETLSLHKHKALILSIGMVEFDPKPLENPIFGAKSLLIPSFVDQLFLQRRVDVGTQKFWSEQPTAASTHWIQGIRAGGQSLGEVCNLVRAFCSGKKRVWANGTQFDLSNLEGLAEDVGHAAPLWHYQAPRDMRTFCRETPATRLVPIGDALDIEGVPHEPIHDCIVQAWQVWGHQNNG